MDNTAVKLEPETQSFADSQSFYRGESFSLAPAYVDPTLDESTAPVNHHEAGPLPFKTLCQMVFKGIEPTYTMKDTHVYSPGTSKTTIRENIMEAFYLMWRQNIGPNIFPALVLILPEKDTSRTYSMGTIVLSRYVLEIMNITRGSEAWNDVVQWKRKDHKRGTHFSKILIDLISARRQDTPGGIYTVEDVNEILENLANPENMKKQYQVGVLTEVMEKMSLMELGYFFDIILKDRILYGMDDLILRMWHPDAPRYYDVVSSLKTVAYRLPNQTIKLNQNDLAVTVGKAFSPQLAKRAVSYKKAIEELNGEFFIEEKMDGERIQLHWMNYGEEIHYWSKRNTDYTYLYGGTKHTITISNHLKFNSNVKNCVLDGEMVGFDPSTNTIMQFGTLKGAAIEAVANPDPDECHPLFIVFDMLYLNDQPLTSLPLRKRKDFLKQILTPEPHYVEIIPTMISKTEDAITSALSKCIEHGAEGLVLKDVNSKYILDRRDKSWTKIKPEYLEDFGDNLDLIVIGREKSRKNIYYCGLRVDEMDTDDTMHPLFWSFCRISNGFDLETHASITNATVGKWRDMQREKPPPELIVFGEKVPPEWIDPRDSIVLQIKARTVDRSGSRSYKVGTTLYNAYCSDLRLDKSWENAATISEFKELKKKKKKMTEKNNAFARKAKRLVNRRKREMEDEVSWNNPADIGTQSTIFNGLTFKILDDCYYQNKKVRREEMETIVKNHGGKVTFNQDGLSDIKALRVIGDKGTNECNGLISKGYDVLKPTWVFDCIESGSIIKVSSIHIHAASLRLRKVAEKRSDTLCGYGFETPFTVDMLTKIFEQNMSVKSLKHIDVDPVLCAVELFGGLHVYLVSSDHRQDNYDSLLVRTRLEGFGAQIVESIDQCNMVVVTKITRETLQEVKKVRRELASLSRRPEYAGKSARVVSAGWVMESVEKGVQVDGQMYNVTIPRE